jgi:hypothetical protein
MPRRKARSKRQIVAALRAAARKLGHPPTSIELQLLTGISRSQVAYRFRGYRAVSVCGRDSRPSADWDWDRVALGPPLGHPWATQGPPKRHARVAHGSIRVSSRICNKRGKMAGGVKKHPLIR